MVLLKDNGCELFQSFKRVHLLFAYKKFVVVKNVKQKQRYAIMTEKPSRVNL